MPYTLLEITPLTMGNHVVKDLSRWNFPSCLRYKRGSSFVVVENPVLNPSQKAIMTGVVNNQRCLRRARFFVAKNNLRQTNPVTIEYSHNYEMNQYCGSFNSIFFYASMPLIIAIARIGSEKSDIYIELYYKKLLSSTLGWKIEK